jgi:hypothetical protein
MRQLQEGVELFNGVALTISNINCMVRRGVNLVGEKKIKFAKLVFYN